MSNPANIVLLQESINLWAKTLGFTPIAITAQADANTVDKAALIAGLIARSDTNAQHFWLTDAINKNAANIAIYADVLATSFNDAAGKSGVLLAKTPTNPYAPKGLSTASMVLIGAAALYFLTKKKGR